MSKWQIAGEQIYPKGDNPFDNRFFGYRRTDLVLPDGRSATYHGVLVGDIVHAVPIDDDLTTYLIRQHRPNARANGSSDVPCLLELPGGVVEPKLGIEQSLHQELRQEVGKRAKTLTKLGVLHPAIGLSDECDTIFLATGLSSERDIHHNEATEQDLVVVAEPFGVLYDRICNSNEPVSAQTVAAMALAAARL
jgi:ADP-ribose pyrophosphatase